jgi:hypothetical protein
MLQTGRNYNQSSERLAKSTYLFPAAIATEELQKGKDTQGFPLVKDFLRSAQLTVFLPDNSLSRY